jgi:hypothetical protein
LRSMFRLDGGSGMDSSTSRNWRRSRWSAGTCRESPAPAGDPVERIVRIGFVRPLTVRPVSGVCARSRSRPVPPTFAAFDRFGEAGALFAFVDRFGEAGAAFPVVDRFREGSAFALPRFAETLCALDRFGAAR